MSFDLLQRVIQRTNEGAEKVRNAVKLDAVIHAGQTQAFVDARAKQKSLRDGYNVNKIVLMGMTESVEFDVTPEVSESRSVSYVEIGELRLPASFSYYNGTNGRTFQINAKFLARTQEEASKSFEELQRLKSWTMPSKGVNDSLGIEDAPETLKLIGYGDTFRSIPVVIHSLNIEYPSEVDYVTTLDGRGFVPIIQTVSVSLKEVHTIMDVELFDIESYRAGTLEGW